MDESESLSDLELDAPPKLTFEEARVQILKEPKILKQKKELLKTLFYYSKDPKKHPRIIRVFMWSLIQPLIQDKTNNKNALFGLLFLNALIANEGTHEQILEAGQPVKFIENNQNLKGTIIEAGIAVDEEFNQDPSFYIERTKEFIKNNKNPIKILVNKILKTESTLIMNEASKALKIFCKSTDVIRLLQHEKSLLTIIRSKFEDADPISQEYILEATSLACKSPEYRREFVENDDVIEILMSQIKSISSKVTYLSLKILRQLAKDEQNLEKLQGDKLRLSHKLIFAFRWLDSKNTQEVTHQGDFQKQEQIKTMDSQSQEHSTELDLIYREISKTFQYILKFYDIHQKLLNNSNSNKDPNDQNNEGFSENDIIDTIINLGRATSDPKTTLNAATSLAHITEILHCNESVASQDAIEFMMDMLKDTKNIKHHRQGCRYFANLSFYSNHRNSLVQNKITAYLLGAIEVDGQLDEDTIKHSAIALANLSSHKDFMSQAQKTSKGDLNSISKGDRGKMKPFNQFKGYYFESTGQYYRLIHLLDSAKEGNINLIQSACITLCNMASKPSLHQHFVQEPEISTIKNCLQNPIDKYSGNELARFMIKLVCNLTKNPDNLPHLSRKGFLEILFDLLNHEKEKEIFGNVVTAISYLSAQKECQDKIIRNDIISKILKPLNELHEVDQKLIMIAITSMLFNGIELQKEFIRNKGLDALLHFMKMKEKLFQQLSCKCFSLLSENHENLQEIINYECLNSIIIQCLRNKDIDLETLKEITKIFINLILWRKLKKETIQTTCYLCDIGLMINDIDMNILSIFCLNALSENEHSHEYIIKTCIDEGGNPDDISQQSSIFSRLNYLLELYDVKQDASEIDSFKKELLVQLITSFYLNLARNEQNIDFLLNLKIFNKLNVLMQKYMKLTQSKGLENSALCYTNTIFAKLLKHEQSKVQCIEEEGYKLFISILQNRSNQHLYLETLDSIKLFLTKREYLSKFQEVPQCIELSTDCYDLNVSFLQVLAILSFEKENHKALKEISFLEKLEERKMFEFIFKHFDDMTEERKKLQAKRKQNKKDAKSDFLDQFNEDKPKRKSKLLERERSNELALAISIILANLSSEEDFVRTLLGISKWKKKDSKKKQEMVQHNNMQNNNQRLVQRNKYDSRISDLPRNDESRFYESQLNLDHSYEEEKMGEGDITYNSNLEQKEFEDYDDQDLMDIPEVERMSRLLNLLAHENSFISEQIAILLANVSNSQYFRRVFITDRCMKALVKILRFDRKQKPTEVTLLAILIGVLNLSSLKEVVKGIENLKFQQCLEDIIKNDQLPYVTKSIALLAISNLYTLSKGNQMTNDAREFTDTKEFAFDMLQYWKQIHEEKNENIEIVKNLVYSSLIFFYNLILKKNNQKDTIRKLINVITDSILGFEDTHIVSIVLELITLFTKEKDSVQLIFKNKQILAYAFDKLKSDHRDILKLSSLALCRLAARLEQNSHADIFISNLKELCHIDIVVENINKNTEDQMNIILKYFLNFLENISSSEKTKTQIDSSQLYDAAIQLYTDKINLENKVSLINIIFNLNFHLQEPRELTKEFLKLLYKTYKEDSLKKDEKIQRKIIVLIVSASAKEENHKSLIKCGFYTQFKRNINELYDKLIEDGEEVELFGLVNIALNKKYMHLIYQDLKKIYKLALKNNKIEFKTKVDLFSECSKFLSKLSASAPDKAIAQTSEKDTSDMIDQCLKALLFALIQLIQILNQREYSMFKYLLNAILEATKNLKNHLIILIKIDHLLDFLQLILMRDFDFQDKEQYDDQVLNFSLRVIVCEIFFNLKAERSFFKRENITESIKLLVSFALKVITMNIDKKMTIISNTLRLLSQMIASVHSQEQAHEKIIRTGAIDLVKEAMTLSKDLQPCINIDAIFCLANMMNIKELALDPALLSQDTVNNALLIYFAYNHQVELDECIITFLYSISKYPEYQNFMKDKSKVLFFLMDKHLDASKEGYKESCRKKIFSTVHNMTENEDICKQLNIAKFIQLTNKMLQQTAQNLYSSDHIHELALKSLINMCRNSNEGLEEANLKELFQGISLLYPKFKSLAKQYSLRLITILTKQWNVQKIEEYLEQIIEIISQFIERCDSVIEMKLAILNLERISFFKKLMTKLAEDQCEVLVRNISNFMQKSLSKEDYKTSIEQLIKFCKKLSKQNRSHDHLVNYKIHEIALEYIQKSQNLKLSELGEKQLKQQLIMIQNVMKMIKNIYEGGNINEEQKIDIYTKINSKEEVISVVDNLLSAYQSNDELAIMIVNIIIWFNSIQNKLDGARVKSWISSFSQRLIESSKPDFQKSRQWYMEKYVFILELLVTKNLDKIDKDITDEILKILEIDNSYFTKTIWFKIIKILAHLQFLQDFAGQQQILENLFHFIVQAYEKANENLCFYYYMRVIIIIVKKIDNNTQIKTSKYYNTIFNNCVMFLKNNYKEKQDTLIQEILLYLIEFFKFLMNFQLMHQSLNQNEIVFHFIEMLSIHDNAYILRALTGSLQDAAKNTVFYPDLLNDRSLNIIFQKILNSSMELKSLENLYECMKNIMMQTKVPVKYLIATTILRLTEQKTSWKDKEEGNIITLLKILQYITKALEDQKDQNNASMIQSDNLETFAEMSKKTIKYSLIAISNILIKSNPEYLYNRRTNLIQLLIDNSVFEDDQQMNLRFLYLLYISLDKNNGKDIQGTTLFNLINFLMGNIFKFKNILLMKEPYYYEIPSFKFTPQLPVLSSFSTTTLLSNQSKPLREGQGQITVGILDHALQSQENIKKASPQPNQDQHLIVQTPFVPGSSSPTSQSHQTSQQSQLIDSFFFEHEDVQLRKIDGIRLSLCMTVKVLYKLSSTKKKSSCQAILEHELSTEIYKYLTPYIDYGDITCMKQIRQVIKLLKNCAEFIQLHSLLLQKDCVQHLIKIVEKSLQEDLENKIINEDFSQALQMKYGNFDPEQMALQRRRVLLIPILKTFIFLCSTLDFHWYLTKHNVIEILNHIKEKEDPKINEVAKEFFEKVVDHCSDTALLLSDNDFTTELESIFKENEFRQLKVLHNIENLLIQKKVKLDKFSNNDLELLHNMLKARLNQEEVINELSSVKKTILNIMCFVYQNRFLKDSTQAFLLYQPKQTLNNNEDEILDQKSQKSPYVICVMEKQEFFQTLLQIAKNPTFNDIQEKMAELLNIYTQSSYLKEDAIIHYILPIYELILQNKTISVQNASYVLESIVRLLKNVDTQNFILYQFDIAQLLSLIIKNENIAFVEQIFTNLELIVKLIYYNPVKVSQSSVLFIKILIEHPNSTEFNRLGLFSLYCISLALQEQQFSQNLFLFQNEQILAAIFNSINIDQKLLLLSEKQSSQQQPDLHSNNHLVAQKLKMVAIQILVNVLEYINQDTENQNNTTSKQVIQKIFIEFDLLSVLLSVSFSSQDHSEEKKLAARAFASLPTSLVIKLNPYVDLNSTYPPEQFTITNYFFSLNSIIKSEDPESIYFAFYALLNFISIVEFQESEERLSRDQIEKMRLNQMDYQSLCASLIKTQLLHNVLIQPQIISDEDVIRVCLKLLITIMFKGTYTRILFLDNGQTLNQQQQQQLQQKHNSNQSYNSITNQNSERQYFSQQVWNQLGIQIAEERDKSREQLQNLIEKLQSFELSEIHLGGYVQFLHLLSQIILTSTQHQGQNHTSEENAKLLPPTNVIAEIIKKASVQLNDQDLGAILSSTDPNDDKNKKLIIYKFFFYNYMLSVTLPDILKVSRKYKPQLSQDEQIIDVPDHIFQALSQILEALKDNQLNERLDQLMIRKQNKVNVEEKKGEEDDDSQSTTISIIRMLLFNMDTMIKISQKQVEQEKRINNETRVPDYLYLNEDNFVILMNLLQDNEENGDIVESIYSLLESFLKASFGNSEHQNVKIMEKSKVLLSQAIKHASVFQCDVAFTVMKNLIAASSKYTNKNEIDRALYQIIPTTMKQNNNRH